MRKIFLVGSLTLLSYAALAQSDPHYTMFMYNKLMYNPAYAGSRDVTSVNATYRDQWVGIEGAPKTINVSADGLVGSYMNPFRKVALGVSFNNETIGVEKNTNIMSYYAYRIETGSSVLSFGLSAGVKLYSANYNQLDLNQQNDPNFAHPINNALLPNFGTGIYWSSEKFYFGMSIPNLIQNYYDKNGLKLNNEKSREIRGYYATAGYAIEASETVKIMPQFMVRYAGNSDYQLPVNCDLNLSAIIHNRFMLGITYRTDNSIEGIVHLQVYKNFNLGYAFDYTLSGLTGYNSGTHEIVIGYDFIKDNSKYTTPRFIKSF